MLLNEFKGYCCNGKYLLMKKKNKVKENNEVGMNWERMMVNDGYCLSLYKVFIWKSFIFVVCVYIYGLI